MTGLATTFGVLLPDPRVIAGRRLATRQANRFGLGGRVAAFATAVADRWSARDVMPTSPGFVPRAGAVGATIQAVSRVDQYFVQPRLSLSFLTWQPPSVDPPTIEVVRPTHRLRELIELKVVRRAIEKVETATSMEVLVRRLAERAERLEQVAERDERTASIPANAGPRSARTSVELPTSPGRPVPMSPPAPADPVEFVARRTAPAGPSVLAAELGPGSPAMMPEIGSSRRSVDTRRSEPPSIDVGRLTDQVMQAIDRRLNVQRERTGRY